MSKVSLGVLEVAYTDEEGATTTGEVAEILEKKYDVMATFVDAHADKIKDDVASVYVLFLNNYLKTGETWGGHKEFPLEKVDSEFSDYLDRDEWQRITGRTIMAAALGLSSRKKDKQYSGPRPAFIDTRLYQRSFRAFLKK